MPPPSPCPPFASRCFFSLTSVWILYLAAHAWGQYTSLCAVLILSGASSIWHWLHFSYTSPASAIDRFASSLAFLFVCLRGTGALNAPLAAGGIVCFVLGTVALLQRDWLWHMFWHTHFRLCAFWMIAVFVAEWTPWEVLALTGLYELHFVVMWRWCEDELFYWNRGGYPEPKNKKG